MWWLLIITYLLSNKCTAQVLYEEIEDISYQIVGIFDKNADTQRRAFNESMRHTHLGAWHLEPLILQPSRADSLSIWRTLCSNNTIRPIAVFGPQTPISDGAIREQCGLASLPHIQATWQPLDPEVEVIIEEEQSELSEEKEEEEEDIEEPVTFKNITINFYPDSNEIAIAYAKLLKYYNWKGFSVLYEDDFGLMRIQKILAEHTEKYPVTVRRLDPEGDNYKVFKELVKYSESRILIDCHVDRILKYMNEAVTLEMVNHYQHYILVSMDTSMVSDKLLQLPSNITWLSITDYSSLKDAQHFLAPRVGKWASDKTILKSSPAVTEFETEALIMDDIANHLLRSLQAMESEGIQRPQNSPCETDDTEPWPFGASLQSHLLKYFRPSTGTKNQETRQQFLKDVVGQVYLILHTLFIHQIRFQETLLMTQTMGVTGNIKFDERGRRVNYTLYVNEIYVSEKRTIGRWESADGDDIKIDISTSSTNLAQSNKKFYVISRKAKPYFYDKQPCAEDDEKCKAEDDPDIPYEGFSVDLVKAIFDIMKTEMNYNYTFEFLRIEDKTYGKYDEKTKKWNGLIGDLLDKKADLAVCDLTITEERKKVVDFSVPFMDLGISILYTKEHKVSPGTYSFLNPYSVEVWMYTATAYCVVSIIMFICSRISPADWENPQPCDKEPEELENIWNFKNCTWLTMGSIMTQGCDILPKAIGSRWVCGMWWFFAMIVCQTYIAQLSAAMTSALENEPINSADDLVKQNKILYGAIDGGSTLEFFKNSKDKTYRKLYDNMMAKSVVLVGSNDEGEKRVLNGKNRYAFFMESCTIEYKLKRNCELKKIGGQLDSKAYGIAMPANSPFRSQINRAILRLKELTRLDNIKKKWWEDKYGAIECEQETDENDVEGDLEMENLIGAFLVLIDGLAICIVITAAEFMNEVRNIVVREQVSHKEAFIKELKASLNFFQLQKPVQRNPSRAPSLAASDQSEERQQQRAAFVENFLDFEKDVQ